MSFLQIEGWASSMTTAEYYRRLQILSDSLEIRAKSTLLTMAEDLVKAARELGMVR